MDQQARHLYQQIKETIQEAIDTGALKPGDRIPSERELADRHKMSRMTVRHAITEMVNQGMLNRRQGKGTFVSQPKIRQGLSGLTSFTEDMRKRGMAPGARVLSTQSGIAPYKVRQALQIDQEAAVIRIERLRLADGEPMALEITHLPERFRELLGQTLENVSLYSMLADRFDVHPTSAVQTIEPVSADSELARILAVREGALLLLLERTSYDQHGQPVEFVSSYYRGDRYRFVVELNRHPS